MSFEIKNEFNHPYFGMIINQMPGYFLWKDIKSAYLFGCIKTAKLFGFDAVEKLIGITDYDIQCPAAEYADLFVKQDKKVQETLSPVTVLDIHPYANDEIKTLLINKSLLVDKDRKPIGVSCHCIEINSYILSEINTYLSKIDPLEAIKKGLYKKAANYYLNGQYPTLNLTQRQSECLFYLIRGKSYGEIGRILNISDRTVESYIEILKSKMGCSYKTEIIEKAIEKGFLEIIPAGVISNRLIEVLRF